MNKSHLSIFMLTRNHERYIEDAIQSVLEQQVNFRYTLLIGDDGSEDQTVKIINTYSEKYPDIIKIHTFPNHRGIFENVMNLY
ncbi:MAG: glycosyltransferase family 2 protein, partial [Fidelibacterota bacterium]